MNFIFQLILLCTFMGLLCSDYFLSLFKSYLHKQIIGYALVFLIGYGTLALISDIKTVLLSLLATAFIVDIPEYLFNQHQIKLRIKRTIELFSEYADAFDHFSEAEKDLYNFYVEEATFNETKVNKNIFELLKSSDKRQKSEPKEVGVVNSL